MQQHEVEPTRRYLSQFSQPSRLEVTIPGTGRAVDGAVWISGRSRSFDGADLVLVQTKRWLTSSVLGQALFSAQLAMDAGAASAKCVALVGEGHPALEALARTPPFSDAVEVVVVPEWFDGGSYPGAPAWSQRAVGLWLDDVEADQKVPMYGGAARRAKGYDRACAVISRPPFRILVNTQKHLGMSVLGRALVARHLLDHDDAIVKTAVVVSRTSRDLIDVAERHGIIVHTEEDGGVHDLIQRASASCTESVLSYLEQAAESSRLLTDLPFPDGGIDEPMLFARLHRAAMNHLSGGNATTARYGIWAVTCRDHVAEALALLEQGDLAAARALLIKAANSLTAFAEVQRQLDPMGIARNT